MHVSVALQLDAKEKNNQYSLYLAPHLTIG